MSAVDTATPAPGPQAGPFQAASPTWRIALAGAVLVWLPELFLPWDWHPTGTPAWVFAFDWLVFLGCYVACGLVLLGSGPRLAPWLEARLPRHPAWQSALGALAALAAVQAAFAVLYIGVVPWLTGIRLPAPAFWRWNIHAAVITLVFHGWQAAYRAARQRSASLERAAAEVDGLQSALAAAELSILQMQVEPHFLFNTLAHVRRELRQAPAVALEMLSALISYLERAGPALRQDDWTIADELELVDSYLALMKHRFGDRLRCAVDAPAPLLRRRLPALSIATLVENAVQHGLAPKAGGGQLRISVAAGHGAAEATCITVLDDGIGLREAQGQGLGLATVRARLRAAFGSRASLTLESTAKPGITGGVCAAIRIAAHA